MSGLSQRCSITLTQSLESSRNSLLYGVKQLVIHQGAFDGCHCVAGRGVWALNWWQIAKHQQVFSELLYQLAFEVPKTKFIRLRKLNSIRTEDLLKGVTRGFVSSLAQYCHHSPHVLPFPSSTIAVLTPFLDLWFLLYWWASWRYGSTHWPKRLFSHFFNHQQYHLPFPKVDTDM